MLKYDSIQELVEQAVFEGKNISDIVLEDQALYMEKTREELLDIMSESFNVMKESIENGLQRDLKSSTGMVGGDAFKLKTAVESGKTLGGKVLDDALIRALAVAEYNACMGRIVAAPTAGSCGILPAVLTTIMEQRNIPVQKVIMSLFTAAGFGIVISKRASISGAEGGCQAECGSASAMAAAAMVELGGGTPEMAADACAIAMKGILGLVCDPVAGLVEVPCVKRNAMGVANAIMAADLALAGIKSVIPVDEVIDAMRTIGVVMGSSLKETAEGGLAATPTGKRLAEELSKK